MNEENAVNRQTRFRVEGSCFLYLSPKKLLAFADTFKGLPLHCLQGLQRNDSKSKWRVQNRTHDIESVLNVPVWFSGLE